MATRSTFDAMLFNQYLRPVRSLVVLSNFTIAQLERKRAQTFGRRFEFGVHTNSAQSIGTVPEMADTPEPMDEEFTSGYDTVVATVGTCRISEDLLESTRRGESAYISPLRDQMVRMGRNLSAEMNRIIHGSGDGALCLLNGAVDGSTTVVTDTPGTKYLKRRMVLDVWDSNTSKYNAIGVQIASVTDSTDFELTSEIDGATNATVVRHGALDSSGNVNEQHGLQNIILGSGTLHNINPSTYPEWISSVTAVSGDPTEIKLITILDNIEVASGRRPGSDSFAVTTQGVRRNIFAQMADKVRFAPQVFKGGWEGLWVEGLGLTGVDTDCATETLYVIDKNAIEIRDLGDFRWQDRDGSVLHRLNRKLGYELKTYRYWQMITRERNALGKGTGITEA